MADNFGYGQLQPEDASSDYNVIQFIINQTLARCRTITIVKVVKSSGTGQVAPPGTVNVQPLVNELDGNNNTYKHSTIFNIPVWRYGSGNGAIICDPAVNDIGVMLVADRDISTLKANNGAQSNPGSNRQFDIADGIYLGSLFGATPSQSVTFKSTGVEIRDNNGNSIISSSTGWAFTGPITSTGNVTAGQGGADQVDLQNHLHGGVTVGGGSTTKPTAGT